MICHFAHISSTILHNLLRKKREKKKCFMTEFVMAIFIVITRSLKQAGSIRFSFFFLSKFMHTISFVEIKLFFKYPQGNIGLKKSRNCVDSTAISYSLLYVMFYKGPVQLNWGIPSGDGWGRIKV